MSSLAARALQGQSLGPLQSVARHQAPHRHHQLVSRYSLPPQLGWLRWQGRFAPHDGGSGRNASRCVAAAVEGRGPRLDTFDPDTYAEELEDPDEYSFAESGGFGEGGSGRAGGGSAAAGRPQAAASLNVKWAAGPDYDSSSSSSSSSAGDEPGEVHTSWQQPLAALNRAYGLLLLFGASLSRLLSRLSTAVLATGRVTWQLGGEALHSLHRNTVHAKDKVAASFQRSRAARKVEKWQKKLEAVQHELPEDLWGKVMWVWDRPDVQKLRLTIFMANFSFRLPALVALVATQIGLLSTSLSLPMLAPLLLGTGMLLRSIRTNASLVFPRIGLLVVMLWLLWFANSVIQNTVAYLRKQGAIDQRLAANINSAAELAVLVTAAVILLSGLGVNVSALLLPAGIALAVGAKDLSHNFLAGFFLMMVQPFRLGDRVGVTLPAGSPGGFGGAGPWFEGVCEKVDLRYTSLRQGKRRLMVPNSAFLQQPFMIMEDVPVGTGGSTGATPETHPVAEAGGAVAYQHITPDNRYVWQAYMNGSPVHQELAQEATQPSRPARTGAEAQQQHAQQQQRQHQAPGMSPPHSHQHQHQQAMGMPPHLQHEGSTPGGPVYYTMAPPGSHPGTAPPGSFPLYPCSDPVPPQAFM